MSEVYEIADKYVLAYAALDPIAATEAGIVGHEHELTDFSPDAADARDRLDRDTLVALRNAPQDDHRDRIAADVMIERLELATAYGASFVHRENYGLTPGARADVVLLDAENVPDVLVRAPRRELVVAGGQVVVLDGELQV